MLAGAEVDRLHRIGSISRMGLRLPWSKEEETVIPLSVAPVHVNVTVVSRLIWIIWKSSGSKTLVNIYLARIFPVVWDHMAQMFFISYRRRCTMAYAYLLEAKCREHRLLETGKLQSDAHATSGCAAYMGYAGTRTLV